MVLKLVLFPSFTSRTSKRWKNQVKMAQSCFLLGFIVLTLVSTISSYPMSRDMTTPSWASTIAPVVEAKLQRHHVIAAVPPKSTQASPVSTSTSDNRTIHCHNLTTCPRQTSLSLQQQSQWSPGDISNIVFGCVSAILGALTLGVTYFLHVQRSQGHQLGRMAPIAKHNTL